MSINEKTLINAIKDHMKTQPYEITCSECGEYLEYDLRLDNDFDIELQVSSCRCVLYPNVSA